MQKIILVESEYREVDERYWRFMFWLNRQTTYAYVVSNQHVPTPLQEVFEKSQIDKDNTVTVGFVTYQIEWA